MQNNCNAEKIRNFICDGLSRKMMMMMSLGREKEKNRFCFYFFSPHNASHDLFSGLTLRSRCACITARDARQNKIRKTTIFEIPEEEKKNDL